jgi:DNA-3-methyladenine glycosylase
MALYRRTARVGIATDVRIGITKAVDLPWRYGLKGSKFVSKPFPSV